MFGHDGFTVTPRRGELIVFDKLARPLVNHVLLPVPTATHQGRPGRADGLRQRHPRPDRRGRRRTRARRARPPRARLPAARTGGGSCPALLDHEVTAIYVGLRAATEHADYQIAVHRRALYVCVGGIRSTGLTASMAIAEYVATAATRRAAAPRASATYPQVQHAEHRRERPAPLRRSRSDRRATPLRRVVCLCERVTRGEIRDARRAPIPARRPRRAAAPHARAPRALPGLLLRRRRVAPLAERERAATPSEVRGQVSMSSARHVHARWLGRGRRRDRRRARRRSPPPTRAATECGASAASSCSTASRKWAGSRATPTTRASACATCVASVRTALRRPLVATRPSGGR